VKFFGATKDHDELAIMLIARDTLMRLSDVKTLEWTNYHGDYIAVVDPKVEPYTVPVSARLRDVLDALPQRSRFVIRRRQRGPGTLAINTIHRIFVEVCKRAWIPQGRKIGGVTFHSLRHTGTTRALERSVPTRAVQAAGGWHSLKQLERYGHVTDEALRQFRERIGGEKPKPSSSVH
jgi:integrase